MKHLISFSLLAVIAVLVSACGSSRRIVIEGYNDAALNGKRLFLLLPKASEVRFTNAALFAESRGVATPAAGETIENELRTDLTAAIQEQFDSNDVFNYADQVVAGMVPLGDAEFTGATPKSWTSLTRAGREGNIDFLLVIRELSVANTSSSDPRGNEVVNLKYSLLDIANEKVMTSGDLSVDIDAPRTPAMTHVRIASALSSKLPFVVVE